MLPIQLPSIELRHGQVLWLLSELGYSAGVSRSTFFEYVKSLRKFGIPFPRGSFRSKPRTLARYSYCDVMELAITLSLRRYHVVPDSVLGEIIRNRARLHQLYRRAYANRSTRKGSAIALETPGRGLIQLRGLFLDLDVRFSGGQLVGFGPPKLLTPADVLVVFAQRMGSGRMFLPYSLSMLSEKVVSLALRAPTIQRRPRPRPQPRKRWSGV
jgi:hypothetical protein